MDRGVAIVTYNRADQIGECIEAVLKNSPNKTKVVVCDDGSTDNTVEEVRKFPVPLISGQNLGVAANKNRALFALQDCDFISILEDDLLPVNDYWFETYEKIALYAGIHHFCRVQDKQIPETVPEFTKDLVTQSIKPIYGSSPRGDFTFITKYVLTKVGGFDPEFKGVGFAHGFWSGRVAKAGLIPHPNRWIDLRILDLDGEDLFEQKGDTTGGRWELTQKQLDKQLRRNRRIRNLLEEKDQIHRPICLP